MKIVILRGGLPPSHRRPGSRTGPERAHGVTAIGDGEGRWALLNISPAVALQLDNQPALQHHAGLLDGGIRALVLSDAQVEHVGGLLSLRDGAPIDLYATPAVFEALTTGLSVLPVLQHYCGVHWHVVPVAGDRHEAQFRVEGMPSLLFTAVATRAPAPRHLGHSAQGMVGDSIALAVHDQTTGQRAFCAPGLAHFGLPEVDWMRQADCLLLDGPDASVLPLAEPPAAQPDWLAQLVALPARHKVLLGPRAAPAAQVARWAAHGIALAYDGMAIDL